MPGRDGTGPRGQGPMTGHGEGDCVLRELPETPGFFMGFLGHEGHSAILKIAPGVLQNRMLRSQRGRRNDR